MTHRICAFRGPAGEPCHSPPLHDGQFCLMHSPEHAQEVQEARRLGGLRRKREATVRGAYEFEGLNTVDGIRRLIEIAATDTLGLENTIPRNRTLAYMAQVALRTLEMGDLETRISVLEQAIHGRRGEPAVKSVFDLEPALLETGEEESK